MRWIAIVLLVTAPSLAWGDVVSYEASVFPEDAGWTRDPFCSPDRTLAEGWLSQDVEPDECLPPPHGDDDAYSRWIPEFDGAPEFFLEARVQVDGSSSEFPWAAPVVLNMFSLGPRFYGWAIASDEVQFDRDNFDEIVFASIEPGVPHTHRLELYGDELYLWYIDGQLIHSNTPGGQYPSGTPGIVWRAKSAFLSASVQWDYIRFGTIPQNGSGDFTGGDEVDLADLPFFEECLATESGNWVGCAWADFDADGDVDCEDALQFQLAWTGPGDPPTFDACSQGCTQDLTDDGAIDAADLAVLLGGWGPNPGHAADFNDDGSLSAADLAPLLGAWGSCQP